MTVANADTPVDLPLPPEPLRRLVCHDDRQFDFDPSKYAVDGIPAELFDSVLDFGCGCGRVARHLMVQPTPPRSYLGIDINRSMVAWCSKFLAPLRDGWRFEHHDVYNKNLGADNSPNRTQPFPVADGTLSLVIAYSVFTHLSLDQTIFYLHEIRRKLRPGGVAKTTWFLFCRHTFPMLLSNQVCLFVSEHDPASAVIYDWEWVRQAATDAGFRIRRMVPPDVPGHQWEIQLEARHDDQPDALPTAEDLKYGLCAAPTSDADLASLPAAHSGDNVSNEKHMDEELAATSESTVAPTPAAPIPAAPAPTERFRFHLNEGVSRASFEEAAAQLDWWYHSYYFDNGFEISGDYDIGADIEDYKFPADINGWRVLDIGAGAGWFSHYFEQRGATVTAVDARGYEEFDVYGRPDYPPVERAPDRLDEEGRPIHHSPVNRGFWVMKELLQSKVTFLNGRVYDVPEVVGDQRFDLVFLGALLCHLRDPIGALMAARRVCDRMVIASTPVVIGEPEDSVEPRQYLPYTSDDRISWWLPNEACFRHWFTAAGFRDADPGPSVLLRGDKPRHAPDGRRFNGDQWIRVGRAYV